MRTIRASIAATLILALATLVLPFQQDQIGQAQTVGPLESKALQYVENVLPFNMSHYNVVVDSAYSLPSAPNDPTVTQAVDVDLNSSDSSIHVVCIYVNGALHQCGISNWGAPPVSDRPYANLEDIAARILLAHQEQTGIDSTDLLNTLSLVNGTETTSVYMGDVSLSVSKMPDIAGLQTINGIPVPIQSNSSMSVLFHWMITVKETTYSLVNLSFDNGVFYNLQDERAINPIDSSQDADAQQASLPSATSLPQSTHDTSIEASHFPKESSTQKNVDPLKEPATPILIIALAIGLIVTITAVVYRSRNQANQTKREASERD